MIPKVSRGFRIYGLVAYLMGPGRHNEHTEQRVIATWDRAPETHQPPMVAGPEAFDVAELAMLLSQPALEAGVPLRNPTRQESTDQKRPQGPVWHCSLRNHASDRVLSDQEWADSVAAVLDATGIAPYDDESGCRWVAIRHADDHVHIAAVLVREDTGRKVYPRRDWNAAMEACRGIEAKLGLTRTEKANRTAVGQATRAELEKATRRGLEEPPRLWLRRVARFAAVAAHDATSYYNTLADLGVLVAWRRTKSGEPRGIAFAAPDDVNAAGQPVWFSGSTLAPDLSLPKLQARWAARSARSGRSHNGAEAVAAEAVVAEAVETMDRARSVLVGERAVGRQGDDALEADRITNSGPLDSPDGIVHAAEDVLIAVCEVTRPLAVPRAVRDGAADAYQRASRQPGVGQPTHWGPIAAELRFIAHQLLTIRTAHGRVPDAGVAGAALVAAIGALLAEIAAYHESRQCLAQASAARSAGALLRAPARSRRPPARPQQEPTRSQRPEVKRLRHVPRPGIGDDPGVYPPGTPPPPTPGRRR